MFWVDLFNGNKNLFDSTEAAAESLAKFISQLREWDKSLSSGPIEEVRREIRVKLLSEKAVSNFNYNTVTYKGIWLDLDTGHKYYGTIPAKFGGVGDRGVIKATIKRSDNDDRFGFFKRPTLVSMIENEGGE